MTAIEPRGPCPYYAALEARAGDGGGGALGASCSHDYSVVPTALLERYREAAEFLQCGGHAHRCQIPHPFRPWVRSA